MSVGLNFELDGARHFRGVLTPSDVGFLADRLEDQISGRPGARLRSDVDLARLLSAEGALGTVAARLLPGAFAVRVVLFDKTVDANWLVAWHQDRTICVAERHNAPDFGPWSVKDGIPHVAPPMTVLNGMALTRPTHRWWSRSVLTALGGSGPKTPPKRRKPVVSGLV